MATLRDIKNRITGIRNTQQITKAMKMVAAAKLRKAQENMVNARPYSRKMSEVINSLIAVIENSESVFLKEREVKKISVVIVTSDRGLCGSFNMNIMRRAEEYLQSLRDQGYSLNDIKIYCFGKKANEFFRKLPYHIEQSYIGLFQELKFEIVADFVNGILNEYAAEKTDSFVIIYNKFKSVMQSEMTIDELLPFKATGNTNPTRIPVSDYIYEPDKEVILESLIPKYIKVHMWSALLESYAAELGARMTAMDMATENSKELIRTLQIKYNKERQAAITKEILEIVSGADALKNS